MALLQSYSAANMLVDTGLAVRYYQSMVKTARANATADNSITAYLDGKMQLVDWRVTRRATKSYKFVGMTEAAAKACADIKKRQYTRVTYTDGTPAVECVADIDVVRTDESDSWEVDINVNETDSKLTSVCVGDPATLFETCADRDYDEGDPTTFAAKPLEFLFALRTAKKNANNSNWTVKFSNFVYAQNIENFSAVMLSVMWRAKGNILWDNLGSVSATNATFTLDPMMNGYNRACQLKLEYDTGTGNEATFIHSNIIEFPDPMYGAISAGEGS
jgi:hypothetical protein